MKHQWLAYVIVAVLSIGAGAAIAGLPDSVPDSPTIVPPTTTEAPLPTTTSAPTTTEAPEPEQTTTTEAPEPTTTVQAPTTTAIPPVPDRAAVNVSVANGAGTNGVAQATADQLEGLGYVDVQALTGNQVVETTIVYFSEGNDVVAVRLAADLGLPPEAIGPIDSAPGTQELGPVQLLVYVGADRA